MDFTSMITTLGLLVVVLGGLLGVEWVSTRSPRRDQQALKRQDNFTLKEASPMAQTTPSTAHVPNRVGLKQALLILIVLFIGTAVPISLLLLASGNALLIQGLMDMEQVIMSMHEFARIYVPFILLPSLAVLLIVALYSQTHFPLLANRIWAGLGAGFVGTFVLDTFRQLGVIHGWLPTDTIMLFGNMIIGPMSPELAWTGAGLIYHFLNGASFGLFYALVWGKAHWAWGIVWGLIVELGMMTLPPMAPMVGPFGSKTGSPALFLITLVAHLGYGIALGLLVRHWLTYSPRLKPGDSGLQAKGARR